MTCFEAMQLKLNILRLQSTAGRTGTSSVESLQLKYTVSKLKPFSGTNHENLAIFLQQCELLFELQPFQFPMDYYQVGFILRYLYRPATYWIYPYLWNKKQKL